MESAGIKMIETEIIYYVAGMITGCVITLVSVYFAVRSKKTD